VRSIPTLLAAKDGTIVKVQLGSLPPEKFAKLIGDIYESRGITFPAGLVFIRGGRRGTVCKTVDYGSIKYTYLVGHNPRRPSI